MIRRTFAIAVSAAMILASTAAVALLSERPEIDVYEETTINVDIIVTIRNLGTSPALDIPLRLAIPVDHERVQVLRGVSYEIEPERRTNDTWGNEFAYYTIDQLDAHESVDFTVHVSILLRSIDFNIMESETCKCENMTRYLAESQLITKNDPAIVELAREIASRSTKLVDLAWDTYRWIIDHINYQQIAGELDAATALKNREGGSAELANLFVALMRANGVPARRISGWGHEFREGTDLFSPRFAHGWAEFYLPPHGWIPVDPTWGKSHKVDNFARSDAEHIVLTRGDGIHFMTMGEYDTPYGSTEVDPEYRIMVTEVHTRNLSLKRDIIVAGLFAGPLLLASFIVVKWHHRRRIA